MKKPTNKEVFEKGEILYDYADDSGNWIVYGLDDEQYHIQFDPMWKTPSYPDDPALTFADLGPIL
jgi:hypothetical protein